MARRRVNRKNFECGHKGFGTLCRRCEAALKFKDMSEAKTRFVTNKKKKDKKLHKVWTPKEMLDECDRLLVVPPRRAYNG